MKCIDGNILCSFSFLGGRRRRNQGKSSPHGVNFHVFSTEGEVTLSTRIVIHCSLLLALAGAVGEQGSYGGGGDRLYYLGCIELHHYSIPEQ